MLPNKWCQETQPEIHRQKNRGPEKQAAAMGALISQEQLAKQNDEGPLAKH